MPERDEKEQEIRSLLEKIVKENFPDLVKEIDMQVQQPQRRELQTSWMQRGPLQDMS